MKELYKKIAKVKSEIGKISKEQTNPFFKSKYFDINALLEHVEPLLSENNLLLLQPITDGKVQSVIIDLDTGQEYFSELQLPDLSDPQKLGSVVTYYRRYTLQSLLGLQAEDDDGNKASVNKTKPTATTKDAAGKEDNKKWLNPEDLAWAKAIKNEMSLDELRKYYKVSKAKGDQYLKEVTKKVEENGND